MKEMTGHRFGKLLVQQMVGKSANGLVRWACVCDCGGTKVVNGASLRRGTTRSCGCLVVDVQRSRLTRHGHKSGGGYSPEYTAWSNIVARCTNPGAQAWANYGGRGITVCERWRADFTAFLADVGPRPSRAHSIDRINNDGHYEPGNVRWATRDVQARNRRPTPRRGDGRFA